MRNLSAAALAISLLLAVGDRAAGAAMPSQLAQVEAVTGKALFRVRHSTSSASPPWLAVDSSFLIGPGELRTNPGGRLELLLAGGSHLRLADATELELDKLRDESNQGSTRIVLRKGQVTVEPEPQAKVDGTFTVVSPFAEVEANGGRFIVRHDTSDKVTIVTVQEGTVVVQPSDRRTPPRRLVSGEQVKVRATGFED